MSSQRGNVSRAVRKSAHGPAGAPRYMNEEGFHHNKGSRMTKIVNAAPVFGLCQRCHDVSLHTRTSKFCFFFLAALHPNKHV